MRDTRASGASLTLFTCLMFGGGNVAYRYGHGDALAIAGSRAAVGALLLAPLIVRISRDGRLAALLKDRWARMTVFVSAIAMVIATLMLRELTGPQAGVIIATLPAVMIGFNRLTGRRHHVPVIPLFICVTAAIIASTTGGIGALTGARIALMGVFLLISVTELLFIERALIRHDSWTLVGTTMPLAAVLAYVLLPITSPNPTLGMSAVGAAILIGVAGTLARWSRALLIDRVGATVTSSTAQITALITAIGGMVLLGDSVETLGAAASLTAALFSFITVLQASRSDKLAASGTKAGAERLSVP